MADDDTSIVAFTEDLILTESSSVFIAEAFASDDTTSTLLLVEIAGRRNGSPDRVKVETAFSIEDTESFIHLLQGAVDAARLKGLLP